jgi:hypothetical protein
MPRFKNPLKNISVATPCSENWDAMTGDEQIRFCQKCQLNVYNLSQMTKREAEALIQEKEGKLCIRYYLRKDGTVLTQDCPYGIKAIKKKVAFVASFVTAMVVSSLTASGLYAANTNDKTTPPPVVMGEPMIMGGMTPFPHGDKEIEKTDPSNPIPPKEYNPRPLMGKIKAPEKKPEDSKKPGKR